MKTIESIRMICDEKGAKVGVIMSVKTFKKLMEKLEDLQDLNSAYKRTQKKEKTVSFEQVFNLKK